MTAGTLNPIQLPASLRAVDSVADAFHVSASTVGSRVYGHPGGLTVRERYILAEKREAHLKQSREAAIQQREKQRQLRGELVRVKKNARRMAVRASMPYGLEEARDRTTHSVVASIKSAGTQRSADLSLRREDTDVGPDISAHVDKVRAVFERMDHTFNMAGARSELRATINSLRQNSATSATVGERDETACQSVDAGNMDVGRKEEAGFPGRSCDADPGVESPRERHLRRRAATCLQKNIRGRLVRRELQDIVWPALHIRGSEELRQRYTVGKENRRVMLLAHFRVVRAAYEGLKAVLPRTSYHQAGSENVHVHQRKSVPARAPSYGKYATLLPTDAGVESPLSHSCGTAEAALQSTSNGGDMKGHTFESGGEKVNQHGIPSSPGGVEDNATHADEAGNEEACRGAVKSVRRESRIVLWALRDAAARVVQEETRSFARRQRWLSEFGQRQGTATTDGTGDEEGFHESSTREDEDRFDGGFQAAEGGLPWVLDARLTTAATTTTTTTTTTASSTRGTTARTATARTTATTSTARRRSQGGSTGQSTSPVSNRFSLLTVESATSPAWRFPRNPGTGVDDPDGGNVAPELEWDPKEAWESEWLHTQQEGVVRRCADGVAARWLLLPSEQLKKRLNEAHFRRNQSRLRHANRGLVNLECQGMFVLPEIIKMQRIFHARRARISYERGRANREAQQAAWKAKKAKERDDRAARWKSSMSRLDLARHSGSKNQRKDFSGVARKVEQGFDKSGGEGVPRQGVLGDLSGKDAPYASAQWSLAVAYHVGSWRGGLRQRHYFGRLTAFLDYRRQRKTALRASVKLRMVKRLQAWAVLLSEEKRSLACEVKARAPAEVVGAHLRFIARTGTWERLLLDLHEILESAVCQREQAVGLLSGQFLPETSGACRHVRRTSESPATAPPPATRGFTSPSRNAAHLQHPRKLLRCSTGSEQQESRATGGLPLPGGLLVGGAPHRPVVSQGQTMDSRHVPRTASRAESRRLARLRGVVDEWTLRRLHPWIVSVLAGSGVQFVPSVPQKYRVGYRMDDTEKVEVLAEKQLTRRYWRLLGGISDAVSRVVAAKVEAATLAAEAGEWNLLLGFAHDLTAKGLLDPPCTLPKLPRRSISTCSSMKLLGVMAKQINNFLAPVRRQRAGGRIGSTSARPSPQPGPAQDPELRFRPIATPDEAEATKLERSHDAMSSVPNWFSEERDLCESCWAMRSSHSAVGGSTCQRCGQTHRRGFAENVSKHDDIVGPAPWQQFSQVQEPLDLFIVHAAYACVLHPGCDKGASLPGRGSLGWWNGGNSEEMWWRAVCGGKRAAQILHSHGCNTIGNLYTYVQGSAAAFSSSSSPARSSGSGRFARKVRAHSKRLRRVVKDEDLAVKISSLLLRLMSAFEELRTQRRWPTVSETAIHHAARKLHLPRTL